MNLAIFLVIEANSGTAAIGVIQVNWSVKIGFFVLSPANVHRKYLDFCLLAEQLTI